MNQTNDRSNKRLRAFFKIFNRFMLLLWRLGLAGYGNGTRWGGWIMVIKHTGRKSGLQRKTPLNYAILDGDIYCTAGFGDAADWYRNIMANPHVEVWLPNERWAGLAQDSTDAPNRVEILRQVLIASGFAASLAGVDPRKLELAELEEMLESYRLVRIQRSQPLTGPGGPGDLAWVWPLSTLVLLGILLLGKRSRRRCC